MKAMIVKDNVIENIVIVDNLDVFPDLVEFIDSAGIGDSIIDGILIKKDVELSINYMLEYLKETDWVNDYKTRHDLGLEIIQEDSLKWTVINKREEFKSYLKMM